MMTNLDLYRQDKQQWQDFAYFAAESEDRGSFDRNEKQRYATLLAIQYDWHESDEDFIRFLFEQEVIARENDSFQGIGEALWLGAYLLAKFQQPRDTLLFCRAKLANFDTFCGFDREFVFWALREKAEAYIFEHQPDLHDEFKNNYASMDLDEWWENLSSRYPEREAEEELLELYDRSIYFGNKDLAREYLEQWQRNEPESEHKDSVLRSAYIELGEFPKAIALTLKELETKETNWDRASCLHSLLKLYSQTQDSVEGLKTIQSIDAEFKQFDNWKDVGLGRMAVHEAFEYVLSIRDVEVARTSFQIADRWFAQMESIAYVGLEAGWKAAQKCGFNQKMKMYKQLATEERQRIDDEMAVIKNN